MSLNNYEIIDILGKGTFGVAHYVQDKRDQKFYVLK